MIAACLIGCATQYQPHGLMGGYSETRINQRAYEVTFQGNGYTSAIAVRRGALHRAADIAQQLGFFGFWISNQDNHVASSIYTDPVDCQTIGTSTSCSGGNSTSINKPTTTIVVNLVTSEEAQKPPPGIVVYDARMLLSQP